MKKSAVTATALVGIYALGHFTVALVHDPLDPGDKPATFGLTLTSSGDTGPLLQQDMVTGHLYKVAQPLKKPDQEQS